MYVPYWQFLITHGYNLSCPSLGLFHRECFEIERYRSEALIFCLLVCAILRDCRHVHVISNYQRTAWGSLSSLFTMLREVFHFCLAVCFRLAGLGASVWFFSTSHFSVGVHGVSCVLLLHPEAYFFLTWVWGIELKIHVYRAGTVTCWVFYLLGPQGAIVGPFE